MSFDDAHKGRIMTHAETLVFHALVGLQSDGTVGRLELCRALQAAQKELALRAPSATEAAVRPEFGAIIDALDQLPNDIADDVENLDRLIRAYAAASPAKQPKWEAE